MENYYKQQTNQTKTKLLNFGHILDNIAVYYKTNYIILLQRVNVARDRNCIVSIERSNWVLYSYNDHLEMWCILGRTDISSVGCSYSLRATSCKKHLTSGYLAGGGGGVVTCVWLACQQGGRVTLSVASCYREWSNGHWLVILDVCELKSNSIFIGMSGTCQDLAT